MKTQDVDLSKLKAGDTVHFRCGGKAEILSVRIKEPERSFKYGVILKNSANERIRYDVLDPVGFYQIGGTLKGTNVEDPLDIIRVEPALRWEDVRPGMAFHHSMALGVIYRYIGPVLSDPRYVFCTKDKKPLEATTYSKEYLTPAPEHNIEVAK